MTDERDDLVILLDEDGKESKFEHLDMIELNGNEYVILLPYSEEDDNEEDDDSEESSEEDDESEEIIILKIEHGEDGEDNFISIEDENELSSVFEEFKQRMDDEYDFEE